MCSQAPESCPYLYGITAAALAVLLANIGTVIVCLTSNIQAQKDMLLFKGVQDLLLAIFIKPVATFIFNKNWKEYVVPLFVYFLGTSIYELYWSTHVGTEFISYMQLY